MATREFEANEIYDLAVLAIEGVPFRIAEEWRENCKESYDRQTNYYDRLNNRRFVRWGLLKRREQLSFDDYVEVCKADTDDGFWIYNEYNWHVRRYDKNIAELQRIRNLAKEHVGAHKMIRVNDEEFKYLRFFSRYAP